MRDFEPVTQSPLLSVISTYCGRVESTCLGAGRWQVAKRQAGGKEADGK